MGSDEERLAPLRFYASEDLGRDRRRRQRMRTDPTWPERTCLAGGRAVASGGVRQYKSFRVLCF